MPYTGAKPRWGYALQGKGALVESIGKLDYRDVSDPSSFDTQHIPMQVVNGFGTVWASIPKANELIAPRGGGRNLGDYIGPGQSKYSEYDASVRKRTKEWLAESGASNFAQPWLSYIGLVASLSAGLSVGKAGEVQLLCRLCTRAV